MGGFDVLAVEPMLLNRKAIKASLCMNPTLAARVMATLNGATLDMPRLAGPPRPRGA